MSYLLLKHWCYTQVLELLEQKPQKQELSDANGFFRSDSHYLFLDFSSIFNKHLNEKQKQLPDSKCLHCLHLFIDTPVCLLSDLW